MKKRGSWWPVWLVGGLAAVGSGLAAVAANRKDESPGGAQLPGPPPADAQANTGLELDNQILLLVEQQVPGVTASVLELRAAITAQPQLTRAVLQRYGETARTLADALLAERQLAASARAEAQGVLDKLAQADLAFTIISYIPIVGSIIQGCYKIARMFGEAYAKEVAEGHGFISSNPQTGIPYFFGWLASADGSGDYWALNLPVLSFLAPIQCAQYLDAEGEIYGPQLRLLTQLCQSRPFGLNVPMVTMTQTGQYTYKFNYRGNNDLSQAASDAGEVYYVDVWEVDDISPTGPRGFDRANPRAWYARAQAEALGLPGSLKNPLRVEPEPGGEYV